jgi:bifunctional non-homologous end joining protein LigD
MAASLAATIEGTMTDQLSLRLRADMPNLPVGLRPMQPRRVDEPFDDADALFEPSWGGRRALAFVGPGPGPGRGDVAFVGDDGTAVPTLPELAGLAARLDARNAVLDGELVVVDDTGRAEGAELERRLAGKPGRTAAYLAFDLLHLDGRSLLNLPLAKRREALRRVLRPGDEVVAVPAIAGEGRALHAAVVAQGLAGVMARARRSPYLPGIRSRLWRFVPADAVVGSAGTSGPAADAAPPGPSSAPFGPATPVLALISRLPLDLGE